MMSGFMLHAVNLANYLQFGSTDLKLILLPFADAILASMMVYCAIGLLFFHRDFFLKFRMKSTSGKVIYWVITFYICASIPGHFRFLVLGDTSYFDFFPWWFSPIIMTVYIFFIIYFFALEESRPHEN